MKFIEDDFIDTSVLSAVLLVNDAMIFHPIRTTSAQVLNIVSSCVEIFHSDVIQIE